MSKQLEKEGWNGNVHVLKLLSQCFFLQPLIYIVIEEPLVCGFFFYMIVSSSSLWFKNHFLIKSFLDRIWTISAYIINALFTKKKKISNHKVVTAVNAYLWNFEPHEFSRAEILNSAFIIQHHQGSKNQQYLSIKYQIAELK